MADDPYQLLGVARDATAAQIRRAYRALAKKHHPDLNPGSKQAEERFKAIAAANELLSDPERRARFDRGEIDASGQEKPPERPSYRGFAEGAEGSRYAYAGGDGFEGEDLGDLFGQMFGQRRPSGPRRGQDLHYSLEVSFLDAVRGGTQRLTLPEGGTLDVRIPPGTEEGQSLRLRGKGSPGQGGSPAGDALIELHVAPHSLFRRDGADIRIEFPLTLKEAALGAKLAVPTPGGPVMLTIPRGSDSGRQLRLRGRGVPAHGGVEAGDLYVTLRVQLGPPDPALDTFLEGWTPPDFDPRRGWEGLQ